jgi:flagellar motor component MotA
MAVILWGGIAAMLVATLMGVFAAYRWPLKPQIAHPGANQDPRRR